MRAAPVEHPPDLFALYAAYPVGPHRRGGACYVLLRFVVSSRSAGPGAARIRGAARRSPNMEQVQCTGMGFWRLENGKLAEHWSNIDHLEMLRQVGLIQTN